MNDDLMKLATNLVSRSYIVQAQSALVSRSKLIKSLLSQRRLPELGWDETSIEQLLQASYHICCISRGAKPQSRH